MKEASWSRQASHDLEAIGAYWEERAGADTAVRILRSILKAADELVSLPSIGHHRREVRRSNVLCWNVEPYVLVFRREPHVRILRVLHGARDFTKFI